MHRCNAAPRCRAKSKRTGLPCRSPAVRGYRVCRMHGARGGAPKGKKNGIFGMAAGRKKLSARRATSTSLPVSCGAEIKSELRCSSQRRYVYSRWSLADSAEALDFGYGL